jgi:hypothetical protein
MKYARIQTFRALLVTCTGLSAPLLTQCAPDPTPASYRIDFKTVEAAIATDFVEVLVYNATGIENKICTDIVSSKREGKELTPPQFRSTKSHTPCELWANVTQPMDVSFGSKAFVAIAKRQGTELLIGCKTAAVGPGKAVAVIPMDMFVEGDPLPETKCTRLSDYCGGACR